jgi:hypothetical protein
MLLACLSTSFFFHPQPLPRRIITKTLAYVAAIMQQSMVCSRKITKQLQTLSSTVKQWDGQAITAVPILEISGDVLNGILNGTTAVSGTTPIGLTDSISILFPGLQSQQRC